MDKDIFKNSILDIYPSYTKKVLLKQAVNDGLIINNKKSNAQMTLNFTDSIDVSEDETVDDKLKHILDSNSILAMVEEYEYRKPYKHFCYFEYADLEIEKIEELVKAGKVNVFDKKSQQPTDDFEKPTIYLLGEFIYLKFSYKLQNDIGSTIKYVMLAIIDKENKILEIRFDRVGIAYKNSYTYYKDKIAKILDYLRENINLNISDIDFKAVVDFMKSECDDITIVAQRMTRNGTTAYLEAYEDEESIIPILGEIDTFIEEQKELFDRDENTREIRKKLQEFRREIEVKSDMPLVKIRMDGSGIKFGITHNYKDTEYSLFMLYGELVGEEMMSSVKEYIMRYYKELRTATSADVISTETM
ncbi:MAG: hypothetical protein ACLVFG_04945 [Lachnospiraceae bacterium]